MGYSQSFSNDWDKWQKTGIATPYSFPHVRNIFYELYIADVIKGVVLDLGCGQNPISNSYLRKPEDNQKYNLFFRRFIEDIKRKKGSQNNSKNGLVRILLDSNPLVSELEKEQDKPFVLEQDLENLDRTTLLNFLSQAYQRAQAQSIGCILASSILNYIWHKRQSIFNFLSAQQKKGDTLFISNIMGLGINLNETTIPKDYQEILDFFKSLSYRTLLCSCDNYDLILLMEKN